MLWIAGYEVGCYLLTPAGSSRDELPAWKVCMAGSLAGMAYWGVPYPADVVKSKIQTGTHGLVVENGAQPSIAAVAKETMRREGVPGFYRGCGITVARAGPGNGTRSTLLRCEPPPRRDTDRGTEPHT